ncbi:MAG: LD-carboxypeptidase [Chitinophagaceae bacterium]
MNRKHFLSSMIAISASLPVLGNEQHNADDEDGGAIIKIPKYLKPGDTIGITSCAGYITMQDVQSSMQQMQNWGFKIKLGNTIGRRDFTFGGTDEERAADLQQMMDDDTIKAIMCARGGYGAVRIIDKLDFSKFLLHPKWIIGFSDITVIHSHLNRNYGIASIHSKMCNSFPDDWAKAEPVQIDSILSIKQALVGEKMKYTAAPNEKNRIGVAEGQLIGGNLKTLESLAGSKSDIITDGKILFVEDTGEYMYSIDRMFWGLKRTGKLANLKGLIIGGFKVKPDDSPDDNFGKTLQDIVLEKLNGYHYPVCFDFPVGHQKNNYALKCGVQHRLEVKQDEVSLTETVAKTKSSVPNSGSRPGEQ